MSKPQAVVFDSSTREVIRRAEARTWVVLLTAMTLVTAGGIAVLHYEWPVVDYSMGTCNPDAVLSDCVSRGRTSVVIGIVAGVVCAMLSVVVHRHRPIRPTITCDDCGGVGWVMDLEPRNGRCPRCAHHSFTYRAYVWRPYGVLGGIHRIVEHGMPGADLIRRFHLTRRSATNRYY